MLIDRRQWVLAQNGVHDIPYREFLKARSGLNSTSRCMTSQTDVSHSQQAWIDVGLVVVHIQACCHKMTRFQCVRQRLLIHQVTAADIHQT